MFRALKVSAGVHNFRPGQLLDLPSDEAEVLLSAGAIESINPEVRSEKPSQKTKRSRPRNPSVNDAAEKNSRSSNESAE